MESDQLIHMIHQRSRMLSNTLNDTLAPFGLSHAQYMIMYMLDTGGPATQAHMRKYLQVEAPTITRTIATMERNGWVEKRPGTDRRTQIIHLTSDTKQALPGIKEQVAEAEKRSLDQLSAREREALYSLLQKMTNERSLER
ncbi:MarR family winged helix-turn-helix transcriptional regulator [Marinococcus halophilus]|uniref:Putative HTH-type transcriptional regulator YwoH n=1 Tax=Marinococcus halophilus TaxID=1371 RepID=A0A510YCT5_MARHA|nr:MarR family transcriptional regulator [Marinococcus halophilus]GEK60167.1 putative HTH-type transcriptional regulator YwoH [Marinococcus halophilus]